MKITLPLETLVVSKATIDFVQKKVGNDWVPVVPEKKKLNLYYADSQYQDAKQKKISLPLENLLQFKDMEEEKIIRSVLGGLIDISKSLDIRDLPSK